MTAAFIEQGLFVSVFLLYKASVLPLNSIERDTNLLRGDNSVPFLSQAAPALPELDIGCLYS